MPSIVITEQDLTAAVSDANNEIVYVPGFADITYKYGEKEGDVARIRYISNLAGSEPTSDLDSSIPKYNESLYTNIVDEKTWLAKSPENEEQLFTYTSSNPSTLLPVGAVNVASVTYEESTIPTPVQYTTTVVEVSGINRVQVTISNESGLEDNTQVTITYNEGTRWELLTNFVNPNVNTPTLCTTTSAFETLFGSSAKLFSTSEDIQVKPMSGTVTYSYTFDNEDLSYYYAKDLINAGLPVYYENIAIYKNNLCDVNDLKPTDIYKYIRNNNDDPTGSWIMDKAEYNIKYITSGAYPTFEYDIDGEGTDYNSGNVAQYLLDLAGTQRGDCIALIDHFDIPERSLNPQDPTSLYASVNGWINANTDNAQYGTMFTPYATYNSDTANKNILFPASYGFLLALAKSIKTNPTWLAVAGLTRGRVPRIISLNTFDRLSNKIADEYEKRNQSVSINAITNIRGYGLTIWGNRSLLYNNEDLTATSFLNLRSMLCDVKKTVYMAAKSCIFEQNSDVLWINFKSKITPLLDRMKSGQGIKDYKIIKLDTDVKAKLKAKILITPIYALEDIEVEIRLVDDIVTVD